MEFLQWTELTPGPFLATFFLGVTSLVLLLWYSHKKHSYWNNLGVSSAEAYPVFGSTLGSFAKPLHDIDMERLHKYGRIYGHYEGNNALLSVGEPELLRRILVKDFQFFTGRRRLMSNDEIIENMLSMLQGEDWKRVRTIITPTFTTGKIKRMVSIFKDCSRTLIQNFKEAAEKGKPIEGKTVYGAYTMDVIASSAFSTKIDSHNDPNNEFIANAKQVFNVGFSWRFLVFFLMPFLMKIFKISLFLPAPLKFFRNVASQIILERNRTGQRRNDFLQLLLDTAKELEDEGKLDMNEKDDIVENYGKDEKSEVFKPIVSTKKTMSQVELIAQCVSFFVGGYETTATTLTLVSYNLALHPDIQEKLIEELDDTLRETNGELTYDAIQNMKYLDNVISETLRLYPPIVRLERCAEDNYKLGDTGLTIPKGMIVSIPVYAIHRDPFLFPEPEKFDPNRFTPDERAKRNQYAYLPFGHGPRNCVALRFALVEVKVCLAYVLSNFRLKRCPETQVPLQWNLGQGLLQPKNVSFSLEVRKDTVKAL